MSYINNKSKFSDVTLVTKIIFVSVMIISPIVWSIAYFTETSTITLLTQSNWCLTKIYYNKIELTPNTTGLKMTMRGSDCKETFKFYNNGLVSFPGFNTPSYEAIWEIKDDSIFITEKEISKNISFDKNLNVVPNIRKNEASFYLRKYSLVIKNNTIKMQSDSLLIVGKVIFNYSISHDRND